jgi:hypothetical protein
MGGIDSPRVSPASLLHLDSCILSWTAVSFSYENYIICMHASIYIPSINLHSVVYFYFTTSRERGGLDDTG